MNIFNWLGRRRATRKYVEILGPALQVKYRKKRPYKADEVIDTIRELNLTEKYIGYAIALYCTKDEYNRTFEFNQSMLEDYKLALLFAYDIALTKARYENFSFGPDENQVDLGGYGNDDDDVDVEIDDDL